MRARRVSEDCGRPVVAHWASCCDEMGYSLQCPGSHDLRASVTGTELDFRVISGSGKPKNPEMSGNLTGVKEMSGILLKVMEMSAKKSCQGKVA